jgi:hypothetical protein
LLIEDGLMPTVEQASGTLRPPYRNYTRQYSPPPFPVKGKLLREHLIAMLETPTRIAGGYVP